MAHSYVVLRVEDPDIGYRARLDYKRDYPLRSWMTGVRFEKQPPEPIVINLKGTEEENWLLGDLWLTPITIMSRRLYDVLLAAGVENLDSYSVELRNPVNGEVYQDFIAFNLIGKVSKAAFEKEEPREKIFRLSESVNVILIHSSIKTAIESAGIDTLSFQELEDFYY